MNIKFCSWFAAVILVLAAAAPVIAQAGRAPSFVVQSLGWIDEDRSVFRFLDLSTNRPWEFGTSTCDVTVEIDDLDGSGPRIVSGTVAHDGIGLRNVDVVYIDVGAANGNRAHGEATITCSFSRSSQGGPIVDATAIGGTPF